MRGHGRQRLLLLVLRFVWWAAAALLIVYTGLSLERKITWPLAVGRVVPPGSVVISTEDIGRLAENIEYYGRGVYALNLHRVSFRRPARPEG